MEEPSFVVLGDAPLPAERGRFLAEHVAIQPEAPVGLGVVEEAVDAGQETVLEMLRIVPAQPVVGESRLLVAGAIAIGVAAKDQIGRNADQHALGQHRDRARQYQAVEEDIAPVHRAVAVLVLQHHDASDRGVLALARDVRHEAAHLDDVEAALVVPIHRHRIDHSGLGGDQLHPETRRDAEGGKGLLRAQHRSGRDLGSLEDLRGRRPPAALKRHAEGSPQHFPPTDARAHSTDPPRCAHLVARSREPAGVRRVDATALQRNWTKTQFRLPDGDLGP